MSEFVELEESSLENRPYSALELAANFRTINSRMVRQNYRDRIAFTF